MAFLLLDKPPPFVPLHVLCCHIADALNTKPLTMLTPLGQQTKDRSLVNTCDAFHTTDAHSLGEKFKHLDGLVQRRIRAVQTVLARLREHLVALGPLAALPVLTLPETPTFDPAVVTGHFRLAFFAPKSQNNSGCSKPAFG